MLQLFIDIAQALQLGADVDLVPVALHQGVRGQPFFLVLLALLAQRSHVGIAAGNALGQRLRFALEDLELVAVVVTEQPALAVVDGVAVVLFVAVAGMLDLPFAGDGAVGIAQRCGVVHAGVIEATGELVAQPLGEGMLAQLQLAGQCVGIDTARMQLVIAAHAEVHQPRADVGAVDPFADLRVMPLVHQQRLRKAVQHALDRATPGHLVLAHLQQLADEGQRGFGNAGVVAQPRAQRLHRCGHARRRFL